MAIKAKTNEVEIRDIFAPITKMYDGPDGFFVEGVMVAEEPDRVREIWDYATSKQSVVDWASDFSRVTAGKSVGNLRSMHGQVSSGKFVVIDPDDSQKLVRAKAQVVDAVEIEKCRLGVYTGFSIKAPYARKWTDPNNPRYTRWTSGPIIEASLVDMPCVRSATFTMKVTNSDRTQEFDRICRFQNYDNEVNLDALARLVSEKMHGRGQNPNEEMDEMTIKELQEKYAALKSQVLDFGKIIEDPNANVKCDKSAADCMDGDCADHKGMDSHGAKARKKEPSGAITHPSGDQPSGDGIPSTNAKFVVVGKDADGNDIYKKVADNGAIKMADIRAAFKEELETALASKVNGLETAVDTLSLAVARIAGVAIPTSVAVREGTAAAEKSAEGKTDAEKLASKSENPAAEAEKLAKEGKPVDGIRAIHAAGPSLTMTNRGIARPA